MEITKAGEREQRILFAVGNTPGDSVPTIIIGVPKGAWEYMRDGKTNNLDLTRIGINFKLIMFGAENHEQARSWLNLAGARDVSDIDVSLKPKDRSS